MKQELWVRLKRYHFDHIVPAHLGDRVRAAFGGRDASTQAFASKVAGKLGWTRDFTMRAIHEYKKFVYLGIVSESSVTPPKVIDQVWHEHLLFTRGYREFCRAVLERDFDHHPELVQSRSQTERFQAQYDRTLAFYVSEFNREPPADIWGTPKFRTTATRAPSPAPRTDDGGPRSSSAYEREPLFMLFGADGGSSDAFHTGGGGGFSGGGSGDSWDGPSDGGADAGAGGDAGSGSDSGGDSGGSGCSSSCGGGGD